MLLRLDTTNAPIAPRYVLLIAECVCVEDVSKQGLGFFKCQVPNFYSTMPEELRDSLDPECDPRDHMELRYGLLQYVNHEAYRSEALEMRRANPDEFRAQAVTMTSNIREYYVLRNLTDSGCSAVPQLIFGGKSPCTENSWVPGGAMYFFITQPIPGERLSSIWPSLTTDEQESITIIARDTYHDIANHGVIVVSCGGGGKSDIYFDRTTSQITFTDPFIFATTNRRSSKPIGMAYFADEWGLRAPERIVQAELEAEAWAAAAKKKGGSLPRPARRPGHEPLQPLPFRPGPGDGTLRNITNRPQSQSPEKKNERFLKLTGMDAQ